MASRSRSFMQFVEQEMGKFPHFVAYAVLEWILIIILFVDGFLAFLANEYAKFFELKVPCLLCTRIDHILVHRHPNSRYNDSICELHKRDISSLAYCHVHRKLSDIKSMCEGCLLSFATEKESDDNTVIEEEDHMKAKKMEGSVQFEINVEGVPRCSCCGELLKTTRPSSMNYNRSYSSNRRLLQQVHSSSSSSPRAALTVTWKNEEPRNMELPHSRYAELKFVPDMEPELAEDEDGYQAGNKEDNKAVSMSLLPDQSDDMTEDVKTPPFGRGNRFFGIPLSPLSSPKWASRLPKKLQLDKSDLPGESNDTSEADGDSILDRLKRQVRSDRKSLIALYMELDEERSASTVAANNAMAMITRLQAEKASVQMEALQYQRLMEEQAEYDQEALRMMKEEVNEIAAELDAYRERYGPLEMEAYDECDVDGNQDFQDLKCPSPSSDSTRDESPLKFESERSFLRGPMTNSEKEKLNASTDYEVHHSDSKSDVMKCKNEEDTGNENKDNPIGEVSNTRQRLGATKGDSGFLEPAATTLELDSEGTNLSKEIALSVHLRQLRKLPQIDSDDADV